MSEDKAPDFDWFVDGHPAPGGSKTAFVPRRKDGSIVMRPGTNYPVVSITDAGGKANKEWRKVVGWQARAALPSGWQPTDRPMLLRLNFWLRRPAGHLTSKGAPSSQWRQYPTVKPDVLKLARSTEDALTLIVWIDDSQVISQVNTKQYCGQGDRTGCRIRITLL